MPLKREGISFAFFFNYYSIVKSLRRKKLSYFMLKHFEMIIKKLQVLKKLMMLLRRWAGGGVYWRKRKRSFCHLINGILMIADSQLTRKAPASYSDGVYRMSGHSRPSPRSISQELMKGSDGLASRRNRTALHTFFGKFLSFQYQKGSKCELGAISNL